jgi:hypothetical protein
MKSEWSTPYPSRFTLQKKRTIPTVYEAGWASEVVLIDTENLALSGTQTPGKVKSHNYFPLYFTKYLIQSKTFQLQVVELNPLPALT